MKLSSVMVSLTEPDIKSLIRDYLKIDGLQITEIHIDDFINIQGEFTKGVKIPFYIKLAVGTISNNILNLSIIKLKLLKINILNSIKNISLKFLIKSFEEYGLIAKKHTISVDLNKLSKKLPYVYFNINKINIYKGSILIYIENLVYSKEIQGIKTKKQKCKRIKIYDDSYALFRKNSKIKIKSKYDRIYEYSMIVPDITVLLYRLFKDKRVCQKHKMLIGFMLSYIVSPINIIPSYIPFVGKIDDIAILFLGLNKIINEVPEKFILDNWEGEEDIVNLVKEAIKKISSFLGDTNINNIISFIDKYYKKSKIKRGLNGK